MGRSIYWSALSESSTFVTCKAPRRLASRTVSGRTQPHETGSVPEKNRNAWRSSQLIIASLYVSFAVAVPVRLSQCAGKSTNCTPCYAVLGGTWLIGLSFNLLVEGRTNWSTVLLGWLPLARLSSQYSCPYAQLMAIDVLR